MSTREWMYGAERQTPFGRWLRSQGHYLDAVEHGVTATDVDMHIHKYKDNCDGLGRREVQLMMAVEVKTRGGLPTEAQRQTLFYLHQILGRWRGKLQCSMTGSRKSVWHFGYFVLSLFGTRPDEHEHVVWCQFDDHGRLRRGRTITVDHLLRILRFEVYPTDIDKPLRLRRHHKVTRVVEVIPEGAGRLFEDERVVTARS